MVLLGDIAVDVYFVCFSVSSHVRSMRFFGLSERKGVDVFFLHSFLSDVFLLHPVCPFLIPILFLCDTTFCFFFLLLLFFLLSLGRLFARRLENKNVMTLPSILLISAFGPIDLLSSVTVLCAN